MTWTSDSDSDLDAAAPATPPPAPAPPRRRRQRTRRPRAHRRATTATPSEGVDDEGADAEDVWRGLQRDAALAAAWPRRALSRPVVVAGEDDGAVVGGEGGGVGVGRARSLTDDDLEELKGCVDLGFGFSYDEIPELCGTLPALELCYSMSQRFLVDDHHQHHSTTPEKKKVEAEAEVEAEAAAALAPASPAQQPIPNWKISSPGDSPDEVKARLKYWAQAVACTVRLCS
uniref:Uncharacterized protein n=1 Tax=Leersia perrieri TaxID=77586 RepID=A0A0D9XR69_9ORYZ